MSINIGDNISYQGAKPLDNRIKYDTVSAMAGTSDTTLYDGCIAYCVESDKTYQWKSTNTSDPTTGKWREFTTGGSSDTVPVTATDGTVSQQTLYGGAEDESRFTSQLALNLSFRLVDYSDAVSILTEWLGDLSASITPSEDVVLHTWNPDANNRLKLVYTTGLELAFRHYTITGQTETLAKDLLHVFFALYSRH